MRSGIRSILGGLPLAIQVSGPFSEVRNKLLTISAIVRFRKNNGWAPYQSDEQWRYETEMDDRVCPVCLMFEATQFFAGDEIPSNFTRAEQIDPLHLVRPRVHEDHTSFDGSILRGECRCTLDWIDPVETLSERLRLEMAEVSQ